MPSFDYIVVPEFRESLEHDYAELESCIQKEAWKSAHVIAGSIVEALLIDYLESSSHPSRAAKNALKFDLAEAIDQCRQEGVITQRTADLCSVVRSFRNLIHPGRMIRLGEQPPGSESSKIAFSLVNLIAEDIERFRRKAFGLTAEQVLSKVLSDRNALSILKHLLSELAAYQQERLLLELIPEARSMVPVDEFDDSDTRLEQCFRMILDGSNAQLRQKVASKFVEIVKTGDGDNVVAHGNAFFRASDLEAIPEGKNREMVKDYLLSRITSLHTSSSLKLTTGIGPFLKRTDVEKWLDPIVMTATSPTQKRPIKDQVMAHAIGEIVGTEPDVDKRIFARLDEWIKHYEGKLNSPERAELTRALKADMEAQLVPF